ncbi:hypothetical protein HDU76_007288 [Blyttiomyces sp. JEL0837]|nr:hypothetical protein HDU76_007288 [Blyttiomyces sp. JEL0837]
MSKALALSKSEQQQHYDLNSTSTSQNRYTMNNPPRPQSTLRRPSTMHINNAIDGVNPERKISMAISRFIIIAMATQFVGCLAMQLVFPAPVSVTPNIAIGKETMDIFRYHFISTYMIISLFLAVISPACLYLLRNVSDANGMRRDIITTVSVGIPSFILWFVVIFATSPAIVTLRVYLPATMFPIVSFLAAHIMSIVVPLYATFRNDWEVKKRMDGAGAGGGVGGSGNGKFLMSGMVMSKAMKRRSRTRDGYGARRKVDRMGNYVSSDGQMETGLQSGNGVGSWISTSLSSLSGGFKMSRTSGDTELLSQYEYDKDLPGIPVTSSTILFTKQVFLKGANNNRQQSNWSPNAPDSSVTPTMTLNGFHSVLTHPTLSLVFKRFAARDFNIESAVFHESIVFFIRACEWLVAEDQYQPQTPTSTQSTYNTGGGNNNNSRTQRDRWVVEKDGSFSKESVYATPPSTQPLPMSHHQNRHGYGSPSQQQQQQHRKHFPTPPSPLNPSTPTSPKQPQNRPLEIHMTPDQVPGIEGTSARGAIVGQCYYIYSTFIKEGSLMEVRCLSMAVKDGIRRCVESGVFMSDMFDRAAEENLRFLYESVYPKAFSETIGN